MPRLLRLLLVQLMRIQLFKLRKHIQLVLLVRQTLISLIYRIQVFLLDLERVPIINLAQLNADLLLQVFQKSQLILVQYHLL